MTSTQPAADFRATHISVVPTHDWPDALRLLFDSFGPRERQTRITATLAAVEKGQLSLVGFRQLRRNGERLGVSLTMSQPDGVHLVWPPVVGADRPDRESLQQALLEELCQRLDNEGARLGQVLLDAYDETTANWLRRAGFVQETALYFLAHDLQGQRTPLPPHVEWVTFDEQSRSRFASTLEATYQQSLDCPWLAGVRTGDEALASHQQSGCFQPDLWRIFTIQEKQSGCRVDAGVCLLNDHPEQDSMELSYFGIIPQCRGQKLGEIVLNAALQLAQERGRASLFLAADALNHYANSLYAELGFTELAQRRVLFRPHGSLARGSSTSS